MTPQFRLLFVFIVCLFTHNVSAQHISFRNYLNEEGSSSSTIYHVFHDSKGFTWFGTEFGVIRFDGKNYLKLTISEGLSDNEVLKIQEDSKGRIWFLTFNGRLSYYYNGKIFNEDNNPILKRIGAFSTLSNLYEDRQGNLWFSGIHNQFLRISPLNEVTRYDFRKVGLLGKESFFYEDASGNIMIVCREGFFKVTGKSVIPQPFTFHLRNVRTHHMNGRSSLLFLSEKGIVAMKDSEQKIIIPTKNLPSNLNQISYLYKDAQENIWVSTLGDGVYLLKAPEYKINNHLLTGTIISSLEQDMENNMWFTTTDEGVYMLPFNHANFNSYTKKEGLSSDKIYSITKDKTNTLWLGLGNGVLNSFKSGVITKYDLNYSKAAYNRINDIFIDDSSNVWCSTDVGGIKLLKTPKNSYKKIIIRYLDETGVGALPFAAKSIAKSSQSKQPTFVHSGNIAALVPNPFGKKDSGYTIQDLPSLPKTRTYSHFYDRNGTLWYANITGLHQYKNKNTNISYGSNHYLLSRRISDIAENQEGYLYLATYGYGILLFRNGRILNHLTKKQGLPSDICKKIFVQKKSLWVATNEGLCKITFNKSRVTALENYRVANGLLSDDIQDIYADEQGVYIATSKGLSILKGNNLQMVTPAPPVYLTQITAGKKEITGASGTKLSYRQNRFIFNFIGITYQDPANIEYRYRLQGINSTWIATLNNTVEFSALTPGKYVFEVMAKKRNSNWSQPVHFAFTIKPPFWETWWFLSFVAIMVLGTVFLISWYLLQQKLTAKIKQLETEHKIQLERERIARDLHDNVGSHLTYIVNRLDSTPYLTQAPDQLTEMEQLRDFTRQTITQLRETIWAIRKENISIGELNEKLQKLLWQLIPPNGPLTYQFNSQANEAILLTPVQTLNIFRIAQEALTNIFKHSKATHCTIEVTTVANKYLQLLLQDNGIGFNLSEVSPAENYGLANMNERAAELKATLEINSEKEKGTRISLVVHLTDAAVFESVSMDNYNRFDYTDLPS